MKLVTVLISSLKIVSLGIDLQTRFIYCIFHRLVSFIVLSLSRDLRRVLFWFNYNFFETPPLRNTFLFRFNSGYGYIPHHRGDISGYELLGILELCSRLGHGYHPI